MLFQGGPVICPQFQNGQAATRQILLMSKILIGDDEEVEPGALGRNEQRAVLDPRPPLFLDSNGFVTGEGMPHLSGNAFVEENLHAAAWCSSSRWLLCKTSTASPRGTEGNDSKK